MGSIRVVYVSQTGMTEALGQSQCIAYLERITEKGFLFDVLSMEPPNTSPDQIASMQRRLDRVGIGWVPLRRTFSHHLRKSTSHRNSSCVRLAARCVRSE